MTDVNDGYFTTKDGLKLHYRDYAGASDRLPLLCLHGLTRNERDFTHIGRRYAPGRRVIALTFRGRGQSDYDPQPERYTPLTYAADVTGLLDELGLARAIFMGTSLGGLVTMTVDALSPQRVAASILNDIGPDLRTEGLDRIRGYVGKQVRFASWEEAGAAIAENNQHLPRSYGAEDWAEAARRTCRQDGDAIIFDYDMGIALPFETQGPAPTIDLWPLFLKLAEKPMLVVRGAESDLLSAEALATMHERAPSMKWVTVPGVAHAPMLDEPEALAAIDAFLTDLP